jgi:predicted CoA-binding protein
MRKTLVIGASENPERYSFKAITNLVSNGHEVKALGLKAGTVAGVAFDTEKIQYPDIDTVSLYVGPKNQADYYDYIQGLQPKRVIFNPGTENPEFENLLKAKGIGVEEACTLVLLATNQYEK